MSPQAMAVVRPKLEITLTDRLKELGARVRRSDVEDAALLKARANQMTPDRIATVVRNTLNNRKPRYEKLFATWELSEEERSFIYSLVTDRDLRTKTAFYDAMRGDIAHAERAQIDVKMMTVTTEGLGGIVGTARAEELLALERAMAAEDRAMILSAARTQNTKRTYER